MSNWQPIETAQPGEQVLGVDKYGNIEVTILYLGGWTYGCCGLDWEPTHWQPLPEPPTQS